MLDRSSQPTPDPSEGSSHPIVPRGPEVHTPYSLSAHRGFDEPRDTERAPDSGAAATYLLATLLRAKWLILGMFVVISGAALPFIWLKMEPTYRATAAIRVRPVVDRLVYRTDENSGVLPLYGSFLNTQVNMIRSNTVLERVLNRRDVRETTWYREMSRHGATAMWTDDSVGGRLRRSDEDGSTEAGEEDERQIAPPTIETLLDSLTVAAVGGTELIEVSMISRYPRDAMVIANAVVNEYLDEERESVSATEVEHTRLLREDIKKLDQEVRDKVVRMYGLSKVWNTLDPEDVRVARFTRFEELKDEVDDLERAVKLTKMELEGLTQRKEGDSEGAATEDSKVLWALRYDSDREWNSWNMALQKTLRAIAIEEARGLGPDHSKMKRLEKEKIDLEQRMQAREDQLKSQGGGAPVAAGIGGESGGMFRNRATLQHHLTRQKQELDLRREQMVTLENELASVREAAEEVAKLKEEIKEARRKIEAFRGRLDERITEQKVAGRIDRASEALMPTRPFKDRRKRLSLAATGGSLVLGIALSLLLSSMNPRVHRPDDVQGCVRAPFLGQLPPFPEDSDILSQCDPVLLEGTRMVRTALLRRIAGTGKQVILVTSPSTDDGKTSLALLLARSLASLGKRTLLVEGDFRRPALSRRLKLESKVGLASLLLGIAKEERAILSTGTAGFDVLLVGERPVDFDPELLANGVFASCLSRWKKRYDYILVDSSPVLPVADARIVAGQADGTIMVLRASRSRRAEVVQAYADLSATGGSLLGTVLVGAIPDLRSHYQGDYGLDHAAFSAAERRT